MQSSGVIVIIHLAGAVALLLWATRLVRTGIERALGATLHRRLGLAFANRASSAAAGLGLAVLLQSSTAVIVMATGFVAGGHVAAAPAIAAAVGADLGSALIALALRMDLSVLAPICLIAGVAAFRGPETGRLRQYGRILIGFGLLLLSLRLIGEATEPLRDSGGVAVLLGAIGTDVAMAFLVSALCAWLFHSSLAAILLAALLADQGVLPTGLVIPVALGVNFGGALIALSLTKGAAPLARIVPIANVSLRGCGALLAMVLVYLGAQTPPILWLQTLTPGNGILAAHIAFNFAVLVLGLIFAQPLGRLIQSIVERPVSKVAALSALNEADLSDAVLAGRNASRETLSLASCIEAMLLQMPRLFQSGSEADFSAIAALDREVDHLYRDIKTYVTRIPDEHTGRTNHSFSVPRLIHAIVKLEQVGDVVAQRVTARARKQRERAHNFSEQGWLEIMALHKELMVTARLACNIIISDDIGIAMRLAGQKTIMRDLERASAAAHVNRLRDGVVATRETSAIHLDTIYDLKEINSLLVELAYPLLEASGRLNDTRLNLKG